MGLDFNRYVQHIPLYTKKQHTNVFSAPTTGHGVTMVYSTHNLRSIMSTGEDNQNSKEAEY